MCEAFTGGFSTFVKILTYAFSLMGILSLSLLQLENLLKVLQLKLLF